MARIITSIVLSLAILLGSWLMYRKFTGNIEEVIVNKEQFVKGVTVAKVTNSVIPISVTSHGKLVATQKVTLIPEVTGIIKSTNFTEGVRYQKGELIFEIENEEIEASLNSVRSEFRGKLILAIPDLKQDYGQDGVKWETYLATVKIDQDLPTLPKFSTIREENFITANGIVALYQRVKNMEIRAKKYRFVAPFDGLITIANVQRGSLIGAGQPVGEISSFGDYELELPINIEYLPYLKTGNKMQLKTVNGQQKYTGQISRINPRANLDAQSITAYINVKDNMLREGMFLEATMDAGSIADAFEIDRSLLNNKNEIFILNPTDSTILLQAVEPVNYKEKTAVVKGLSDGTIMLQKVPPGAYWGMKVNVLNEIK
jgi:multidrug efflux pump subunit AcrA (membrane-fusion protein)